MKTTKLFTPDEVKTLVAEAGVQMMDEMGVFIDENGKSITTEIVLATTIRIKTIVEEKMEAIMKGDKKWQEQN